MLRRIREFQVKDRLKKFWENQKGGGKRYFEVEQGYDKGMYENTCFNWIKIIAAIFWLWGSEFLWFLCIFLPGIYWSYTVMYIEIGMWVVAMIVSSI